MLCYFVRWIIFCIEKEGKTNYGNKKLEKKQEDINILLLSQMQTLQRPKRQISWAPKIEHLGGRLTPLPVLIAGNPGEIQDRVTRVKSWVSAASVCMPSFGVIEKVLLRKGDGVFWVHSHFAKSGNFQLQSWQSFKVFWVRSFITL